MEQRYPSINILEDAESIAMDAMDAESRVNFPVQALKDLLFVVASSHDERVRQSISQSESNSDLDIAHQLQHKAAIALPVASGYAKFPLYLTRSEISFIQDSLDDHPRTDRVASTLDDFDRLSGSSRQQAIKSLEYAQQDPHKRKFLVRRESLEAFENALDWHVSEAKVNMIKARTSEAQLQAYEKIIRAMRNAKNVSKNPTLREVALYGPQVSSIIPQKRILWDVLSKKDYHSSFFIMYWIPRFNTFLALFPRLSSTTIGAYT